MTAAASLPAAPLALRDTAWSPGRSRSGVSSAKELEQPSALATITVSRQSPEDVGFREIFVSVDGQSLAILLYGETVTHDLPAGPHRVRAHNTLFWKTHDIVLQPGEHARFVAINRAGFGTFGFMLFLGASPVYLTFERVQE